MVLVLVDRGSEKFRVLGCSDTATGGAAPARGEQGRLFHCCIEYGKTTRFMRCPRPGRPFCDFYAVKDDGRAKTKALYSMQSSPRVQQAEGGGVAFFAIPS